MIVEASLLKRRRKTRMPQYALRVSGLLYIGLMILVPLLVILQDGLRQGFSELIHQINLPIARHAIFLTLWTSTLMTVINAIMGLATAYTLVRFEFPGKRLLNAVIDLPLSIPRKLSVVSCWKNSTCRSSSPRRELSFLYFSFHSLSWCAISNRCSRIWTRPRNGQQLPLGQTTGASSGKWSCPRLYRPC